MEKGDDTTEVIIEELQSGYKLGDEIICCAVVEVATR